MKIKVSNFAHHNNYCHKQNHCNNRLASDLIRMFSRLSPTGESGPKKPLARAKYYEDVYGLSRLEEDRFETYAFDYCESESSSGEEREKSASKPIEMIPKTPGPSGMAV